MDSDQVVVGSWMAECADWRYRNGTACKCIWFASQKCGIDVSVVAPEARDLAIAILRVLPEAERQAVRDATRWTDAHE